MVKTSCSALRPSEIAVDAPTDGIQHEKERSSLRVSRSIRLKEMRRRDSEYFPHYLPEAYILVIRSRQYERSFIL
jgi:hypothetical protein